MQQEVKTAFASLKDKSKILIIYNKSKNLNHHENCTEVFIDASRDSMQTILNKVMQEIEKSKKAIKQKAPLKKDEQTISPLGGILLVGLGLLALDSLFNSKKN